MATEPTPSGGWAAPLAWGAVALDGFDLVVLGALIPTLTDAASGAPWMSVQAATAISTGGLVGMMAGALGIGAATDILGRRKVLIGTVFAFSLFTLLCAFAATPWQLGLFRFFAGVGFGGCLPTAIALVTEFSRGHAGKASTTVMTGYHVGAVATAILGLAVLPNFGWRPMFAAGAIPGFILVPLMMRHLPESPAFLAGRKAKAEGKAAAPGIATLFGPDYRRNSLAIWVTSFMGLLLVYGLNTWLPKLMVEANYGLSRGLWFLLLLNAGAILGLLVAGRVGDRIGLRIATRIWFLCGAVLLAALAVRWPIGMLYPAVFLTGCFVFSAQVLVYAYVAASHPPEIRGAALGMSAGVGRLGAISGPLLGGILLSMGLGHPWGFFAFAVVGLAAAVAITMTTVAGRTVPAARAQKA